MLKLPYKEILSVIPISQTTLIHLNQDGVDLTEIYTVLKNPKATLRQRKRKLYETEAITEQLKDIIWEKLMGDRLW